MSHLKFTPCNIITIYLFSNLTLTLLLSSPPALPPTCLPTSPLSYPKDPSPPNVLFFLAEKSSGSSQGCCVRWVTAFWYIRTFKSELNKRWLE